MAKSANQAPPPPPDVEATGSDRPLPPAPPDIAEQSGEGRESQERKAARQRGRQRGSGQSQGEAGATSDANPELAQRAFTALAENVRDYAIFLMDPDGIIRYWGEGAHLMKRWTRAEAEGAHLRLLYPDGGAEDGTAEGHLLESAETGESVSEGHRVRGDGTTFWAHITLTALRSDDGTLLGFAKLTRDMTAQQQAASVVSKAQREEALQSARRESRELAAEVDVLKEELAVLREELRSRDEPGASR
jgi:PAS domain S-box-containing protein